MFKKITLLGAGSGFMQPLFTDILNIEGMESGIIGLVDIDAARLKVNLKLMQRVLALMGKTGWTIQASTDRREVLKGTDYLISTIEVSGTACVRFDNDIPLRYGIDQCIGDTIGPGGVMKALRTLPVFVEILRDAKKYCPHAIIMNYTNPMSIMTLGSTRVTDQPLVGLCHSVQGSSRNFASYAGVPYEETTWKCGGINHMAWFTEFSWRGHDLYPVVREAMKKTSVYEKDPVRLEMMKEFGLYVTESSGHFSEYVPYFRKRKDLIKKFCRKDYLGGSSFYADNWPRWRQETDKKRVAMANGTQDINLTRGHEYASDIIEAHAFNRPKIIYASVPNTGLIPNLPQTGVVEVAVLVDRRGYMPTYFGPLPEQVAALCRSNMAVFELAVDGILNHNRESVIQAMMVDPLSAAVCSPQEVRQMADELFRAEKAYIPEWLQVKKVKNTDAVVAQQVRKQVAALSKKASVKTGDAAAQVSSMAARNVK
ncbi:MAG: alpha-glucosidase/alpha-galactosidase [bacterium]